MEFPYMEPDSGKECPLQGPGKLPGEGKTEWVFLHNAAGRIAGEFVNLYPPGTPLAVPGEIYSEVLLQEIDHFVKEGLNVQGIRCEGDKIVIPVLKNE